MYFVLCVYRHICLRFKQECSWTIKRHCNRCKRESFSPQCLFPSLPIGSWWPAALRQLVVVGRPDASWCQEKSSKPLDGNKTFEPLNGTMTGTMISALRPAKKPNLLYPTNQQTQHPQIDPDHFTSQNTKEHENTNFFDNPLITIRHFLKLHPGCGDLRPGCGNLRPSCRHPFWKNCCKARPEG